MAEAHTKTLEPIPHHRVRVFENHRTAVAAAAECFAACLGRVCRSRVALAGGSTPKALYSLLAGPEFDRALPWPMIDFFFGDERCVPPNDSESNFAMVQEVLFTPRSINQNQVARWQGERPPREALELARRRLLVLAGRQPMFDVVLLGLGEDAHTASLFPGAVPDTHQFAALAQHPQTGQPRITLTPRALRSTRETFFLVLGENKARAVARSLQLEAGSGLPARLVCRKAVWFLDRHAASGLDDY